MSGFTWIGSRNSGTEDDWKSTDEDKRKEMRVENAETDCGEKLGARWTTVRLSD